jgi:DNA polymerase III delta prime subunit
LLKTHYNLKLIAIAARGITYKIIGWIQDFLAIYNISISSSDMIASEIEYLLAKSKLEYETRQKLLSEKLERIKKSN